MSLAVNKFILFLFFLLTTFAPHVEFWKKIYGTYTRNQGVLHDKNDLSVIYTVIELVPETTPGADKINEKLVKLSRIYYRNLLKKFADGKKPLTKEEWRIFNLFKRLFLSSL